MRPLSLTLEGLRSFRSPVSVDFSGRDHIAIIGDTGAGKSSLLEAMTWALYGRTSWSGQPNQELVNDTSTSARVVLRFRVRDQTWQVTRTLRRRGDRTIGPAKVALVRLDHGHQPIEQVEGVAAVRSRVEQLLGLDDKAFTRTVVLPQGQFAQLLLGEGDVPRVAILRQVWRLDELEAAAHAAVLAATQLAPMRARLAQALADEPGDPAHHLADLEASAARLCEQERAAAAALEAAGEAVAQLGRARETMELVDQISQHLGYDAAGDRALAASIAAHSQRLAGEREELIAGRASLAQRLAGIPADDDGLTAAQVATAQSTIQRLPALVQRALEAAGVSRTAGHDQERARRDADALAAHARAAQDGARALGEARALPAQSLDQARSALVSGQRLLDAARSRATAVAELTRKAAENSEHAGRLAAALNHARDYAVEAERTAEDAKAALGQAQREHAAAAAAAGLHPGDPCPVCDRALADGWQAPHAHAIDDARAAAERAAAAARTAAGAVTRLETQLAQSTRQAGELRDQAAAAGVALAGALEPLAELLDTSAVDLERPDELVLDRLVGAAAAAETALAAHDEQLRRARDEAAELGRAAAAAAATAAGKAEQAEEALRAASRALTDAREALASLPAGVEVAIDLPCSADDLDEVSLAGVHASLDALDARHQVLAERERQRRELRSRIEQHDTAIAELDARRQREVKAPADQLCAAVERHGKVLTRAATRLGVADIEPPAVSGVDPSALGAIVDQVAGHRRRLLAVATSQRQAALASSEQARSVLRRQADALGLGGDADPGVVQQRAADRHADALFAAKAAAKQAESFAGRVGPLIRARETAAALEATAVAIDDLVAGLKDGAFPKWVTLRRSRALLAHASRLLGVMTAGRYAFADLNDENDDWRIIDNDSGMPRSPSSLSGGEQFVASLALAFGMVEMMARSGGRLESLWLDEGFGGLDRSNLDAAVEALSTLASGGRLVAVISHIRAVAEQVPDVLAVTRTSTGSSARWLSHAERAQVAEADGADDQALGALAGLLE